MSWCAFDIAALEAEATALEAQSADPAFWNDPQSAQDVMKRLSSIRARIDTWRALESKADELLQLVDLAEAEDDEATAADIDRDAAALEKRLGGLEFELTFSGPYDDRNAIVAIHAGTIGI